MNTINEFKKAISQGHTRDVIDNLLNLNLPESKQKSLILISRQYYSLMAQENKGLLYQEQRTIEENRIADRLLNFIFDLNNNAQQQKYRIQCFTVAIDTVKSSWKAYPDVELAFFQNKNNSKSPFPIFNFGFRNNTENETFFTKIQLNVKNLGAGIHGPPEAVVMQPLATHYWALSGENNSSVLPNPIRCPAHAAFLFQLHLAVEPFDESVTGKYLIDGRSLS